MAAKAEKPAAPGKTGKPSTDDPLPGAPLPKHLAALEEAHPGAVLGHELLADGVPVLQVAPASLFTLARAVKDAGYGILSLLSGYDTGDGLGVLYAFVRPTATSSDFGEVRLRVSFAKDEVSPTTQSLVDLMPAAGWHERETWDLYGIHFEGNPDHRRIFLPEGWKGHPGRKDYAEDEQFVAMQDGEDVVYANEKEGSW